MPSSRKLSALLLALATALGAGAPAWRAGAGAYTTREEALRQAFPEAESVERRNFVLEPEQAARVEELARAPLDSRIATVYTARKGGRVIGHAIIDVHTVRTQPEAFLVVLGPEGEIRNLRVLAFYEPEEYRPAERWLELFEGATLDEAEKLPGRIHGIAGATLSSRAVNRAVRRALALHRVLLAGEGGGSGRPGAGRTAGGTESPPLGGSR